MSHAAADETKRRVFAEEASRETTYFCLECGHPVRLRDGPHRRPHFFHLATTSRCRIGGKSDAHLALQELLFEQLGPKEVELELPFPSIRRIADVFWERRNLVIEVQCSPMLPAHMQARTLDYHWAGKEILWLFWDQTFEKEKYGFIEFLPHFFFSWEEGVFSFHTAKKEEIALIPLLKETKPPPSSNRTFSLPGAFCNFLTY